MGLHNLVVNKFNNFINHLAGWNRLLIFIMFSILINSLPFISILVAVVNDYSTNPDYYFSFIVGFVLQQCFFTLVMTFILIEISKVKVKPFYQAFIFVLSLILIKMLMSIYTYVSVGLSVSSIDFIRQVTNSVRLWLYCYILSWFCFTVVNTSSRIKKE